MHKNNSTTRKTVHLPVRTTYVILTGNMTLYLGLRALFPQTSFYLARPEEDYFLESLSTGEPIVLLIDSNIFISGQWKGYFSLAERYHHISRIWLGHRLTGRLLPDCCIGDGFLPANLPVHLLRKGILHLVSAARRSRHNRIPPPGLTRTEKMLLPWFLKGSSIIQLEKIMGISRKTLYLHRQHVLQKAGFTSAAFMSLVYWRSREFFISKGIGLPPAVRIYFRIKPHWNREG